MTCIPWLPRLTRGRPAGHSPPVIIAPRALRRAPLRRALVLLALTASALAAVETVLAVVATRQDVVLTAAFPVVGAAFVVLGAVAWVRRPANGTGLLLCVAGLLILMATLADVGGPAPLTNTGSLLAETPIAAVLHVVLAFPSGRAVSRQAVQLVCALYALVLVRQAPVVLPGPALEPLRTSCSYLGAGVILLAAIHLVQRVRRNSAAGAERRVLAAAYAYGIALLLFFPFSARVLQPLLGFDASTLGAVQTAGLAVLPVMLGAGVFVGGFGWTHDLDELSSWLGAQAQDDVELRDVLAQVLGDPTLDVVFTDVDAVGSIGAGTTNLQRGIVRIRGADGHDAGVSLTYDRGLFADPAPLEEAGRIVAVALERERLRGELLAEREALRTSRARVLEVGDRERRRLAHDLHDVLQSRLTLVAMQAGRLAAESESGLRPHLVVALRDQLDTLTTEVRQLVHDVMPPMLLERGLPAAVEDLVDRLPLPARLELDGSEQAPLTLATNAYFILAEALANAVRHAHARQLVVRVVAQPDALLLVVADDGIGGVPETATSLRSIAERVEALDGRLTVRSSAGVGTTVEVVLPCAW
jgi:signal transduction histidine kinase